jgi:hypothetical protein
MSAAGTITVKITAQEADLRAQLAVAKADLAQFTGQVRSLSSEMVATGKVADASLNTALRTATTGAVAAGQSVATLEKEVAKFGGTSHGSISTATREFRALFDELSSGRTRMTPGTLAIIAQRVFGLSGAALAGVGAVVAFAAALAYLGVRALETANEIEKIQLSGLGTKGFDASKEEIASFIDRLDALPQVSSSVAEQVVSDFATMQNRSEATISGLSAATEAWAELTGQQTDKAAESLKKVFGEPASAQAREFLTSLRGVTSGEIDAYDKAREAGNVFDQQRILLEALSHTIDQSRGKLEEHSASIHTNWRNFLEWIGIAGEFSSTETANEVLLDQSKQKWDALAGAIHNAVEQLGGAKAGPSDALSKGLDIADKVDTARVHIADLKGEIAQMQAALAAPGASNTMKANLNAAIKVAQEDIVQTQHSADQKATLQERLAEEAARKAAAAARQGGQEEINAVKETISQINADETLGSKEREAAINQAYQGLLNSGRITAQQRVSIERELNQQLAEEHRQAAAQQRQDAQSTLSADLEIAKIGFQEKRDQLQEEVAEGKITKARELADLLDVAKAEGQAQQDSLTRAEQGYAADSAFFIAKENEKRVAAAQTQQELDRINAQIAQNNLATSRQDAQGWSLAINEITSSERTMLGGLLSGRESFYQAAARASSELIQKEIEDDVAYYTKKLLLSDQEFAADQAKEQGGVLVHLAGEAAKTGATTTGVATRTAVTAAGATAGNAATVASDRTSIMNSAYVSAAEAYKSVMASVPPPVNLVLAPIAAAGVFTAVLAYDAIASLDTGTNYVPHDMMANIHEGERVIPRADNAALIGALSGGGGGRGDTTTNISNQFNHTINAPEQRSMQQMLDEQGSDMKAWFSAQVRNGWNPFGR